MFASVHLQKPKLGILPKFQRYAAIGLTLLFAGCALPPKAGDIVHASIVFVVHESLYETIRTDPKDELLRNPNRTRDILYAINQGVTPGDIRNRRLVMASCRYGSNSGEHFLVLLPKGIKIDSGHRVELELKAGIPSTASRPGTFSEFLKVLPYRAQGRTNCNPAENA